MTQVFMSRDDFFGSLLKPRQAFCSALDLGNDALKVALEASKVNAKCDALRNFIEELFRIILSADSRS